MNLSRSDLTGLQVFEAVARNGGFSAAQLELGLSQPTISNHIAALETRFGVRLCERGRSGFALTEKGRFVLAAARRLFSALEEFSGDVDDLRDRIVGDLRLGIVDAISTDPIMGLPQTIARFKARAPDVFLEIYEETPHVLQERVRTGDLHFGIGSFTIKTKEIDYQPLYSETHGVFCAKGHPLFDHAAQVTSPEEVRHLPIVSRGYWRDDMMRELGFSNVGAVSYQIEPQLILILSGQYLGFLPNHYAQNLVADGRLRQICPDALTYVCHFDLISRRSSTKTRMKTLFAGAVLAAHSGI